MNRLVIAAFVCGITGGTAVAATAPAFGTDTAAAATTAADSGDCARSMQIIAADLRDPRFAALPAVARGEILTAWSRCAVELGGATRQH